MQRALWGGAALGAGVEKEPQMASLAGASKPDPHFPNPPSQSPAHFSDPQPNSPAPPSWLLPSPLACHHTHFHITPVGRQGEEGQGQLSGALNREVSVPLFTTLNPPLLSPPPPPRPQTNSSPSMHSP